MAYNFPLLGLFGKAPVRLLKYFLFMLNGMIVAHNSCVFAIFFRVKMSVLFNFQIWFYRFSVLGFFCSWSRCTRAVAIVLGVALKQHPWRYWINSVFLSLVMIAWARCLNGLEMGMSCKPSILFMCPFKISVLFLIILISFLSNMDMQLLPHSWPKEIIKALCIPSKSVPSFNVCLDFLAVV